MSLTILIVEDQPMHARLFSEMLKGIGHTAVVARSGLEGVTIASVLQPALIIVDVLLPDLDGREVIAKLRGQARTEATPILAISALVDREMQEICLAVGADSFLAKPVRLHQFHATIANLLAGQQPRTH